MICVGAAPIWIWISPVTDPPPPLDPCRQIAYDGLLLDGTLADYEDAFNAVDSSGNGTIGGCGTD